MKLIFRIIIPLFLLLIPVLVGGTIESLSYSEPFRWVRLRNLFNIPGWLFEGIPYTLKFLFKNYPVLTPIALIINVYLLYRWFKKPSWKLAGMLFGTLIFIGPCAPLVYTVIRIIIT